MPLSSMTGFGRAFGQEGEASWSWEIRTVNNRGLDIRLRLPQGYEGIEHALKTLIAASIARGSLSASLSLKAASQSADLRLNEPVLLKLLEIVERAKAITGQTRDVPLEALLNLKGVIEVSDPPPAGEDSPLAQGLIRSFGEALREAVQARRSEGARLEAVLSEKLSEIETLTREAEAAPARRPEAIAERLRQQLGRLLLENASLDPARLYQEAALIATRADIEEEVKRLFAHVAAARELIASGAPVGRKLEFLAQEFQREANTLCSKSNAAEITRIGLALKAAIDQFREQVQNVE